MTSSKPEEIDVRVMVLAVVPQHVHRAPCGPECPVWGYGVFQDAEELQDLLYGAVVGLS